MAERLKRALAAQVGAEPDREVRDGVGTTLADIAARGDAALRKPAAEFAGWDREDHRLSPAEIDACADGPTAPDIRDIAFPQAQVRKFAPIQRDGSRDVAVETLPGVTPGHKHIPVNAAGCDVPGGKHPLLASALRGVITAKVAGVPRAIACAKVLEAVE